MKADELVHIGKITRTFGSKGEILIQFEVIEAGRLRKPEVFFVKIGEDLVPFFIEQFRVNPKNQVVVKFLDVDQDNEISPLLGRDVYIQPSSLPKSSSKRDTLFDLSGFSVSDLHYGEIGKIISILDLPQHSLLSVEKDGKEILIPVAEEIILKVDRKNKIIYTDVPEGLLDLNT